MLGFIYNVLDWSYRRLVTITTILFWAILLVLAILGFILSEIIIPVLIIFWITWIGFLWWTKRKTETGVKWTLKSSWQQFKDWRYGRKKRHEVEEREEYVGI